MRPEAIRIAACGATVAWLAGCTTTMGQLTNAGESTCAAALQGALEDVLVAQGETAPDAAALASRARHTLAQVRLGPRPFRVAAPSGTDYAFFVEPTREACVLRLYGRQRGFTRYTNNLTWIDSRPLTGCDCAP